MANNGEILGLNFQEKRGIYSEGSPSSQRPQFWDPSVTPTASFPCCFSSIGTRRRNRITSANIALPFGISL